MEGGEGNKKRNQTKVHKKWAITLYLNYTHVHAYYPKLYEYTITTLNYNLYFTLYLTINWKKKHVTYGSCDLCILSHEKIELLIFNLLK